MLIAACSTSAQHYSNLQSQVRHGDTFNIIITHLYAYIRVNRVHIILYYIILHCSFVYRQFFENTE